jgi:hypothetical protein
MTAIEDIKATHRVLVMQMACLTTRFHGAVTRFDEAECEVELPLWPRQPGEIPSDSLSDVSRHLLVADGCQWRESAPACHRLWAQHQTGIMGV